MKIRFPYPGEQAINYQFIQGYASNPTNGATGKPFYTQHHGGWDLVPLTGRGGNFWPAPIYPVLDGKTVSTSTTDVDRGLGIAVETILDASLVAYFKSKGCIPADYNGPVTMHHLYWHCLKVTDLDGQVYENTQVGLTGNSGYVFHGGLPVPADQKNKPPYPGAHLHFEYYLFGTTGRFNLDKDQIGRIDPEILFNYKGDDMEFVKITDTEFGLLFTTDFVKTVVRFTSGSDAQEKLKNVPGALKPDGTVDFSKARRINL